MIRDLVMSVEPLARKNGNRLELDCPADLGPGVGDPTRMRQCVLNLVGNACKFTADGTVTATARKRDRAGPRLPHGGRGGHRHRHDAGADGAALPAVHAGGLVGSGRKYGGTGLGLAISQKLCHAMGGAITVASEAGKGSTFTLKVRLALEPAAKGG